MNLKVFKRPKFPRMRTPFPSHNVTTETTRTPVEQGDDDTTYTESRFRALRRWAVVIEPCNKMQNEILGCYVDFGDDVGDGQRKENVSA